MSASNHPFDKLLARLEKVHRASDTQATALCPAHEDHERSLSIGLGNDGRVLLKCFAGCALEIIVQALDLKICDLFPKQSGEGGIPSSPEAGATVQHPPRKAGPQAQKRADGDKEPLHPQAAPPDATVQRRELTGCTLEQYSEEKGLPLLFLKGLGMATINYVDVKAVRIPYLDGTGQTISTRFRVALKGDDRFRWKSGNKAQPYGLWRLDRARQIGHLVLCEGESDCQTLWHHEEPALGIPGAATWKEEWSGHLDLIDTIYLIVEPDQGGDTLLKHLSRSALGERLRLISLGNLKDASGLYLDDPNRFLERWRQAKDESVPWSQHTQAQANAARDKAWSICAELAQKPSILDQMVTALKKRGLVGEKRTAKLLYLFVTSRYLLRPVSGVVKGPSSAGKSFLVEQVLALHPADAYYALSAMSERALAYSVEPLKHRTLVIYEAAGIAGDTQSYLIRSLLSEGRIRYETIEKTKDGLRPRLIEREGPTGLIVTTTAVSLHPENETRLISLIATDTQEQTKAILNALAQDSGPAASREDLSVWHALQTWISHSEHRVSIPYAPTLSGNIPPVAVRLRRDFSALLSLVKAHAILHQATRTHDTQGRIIASIEDYRVIRELVADLISDGVGATVSQEVRETVSAAVTLSSSAPNGEVSLRMLCDQLKLDKSSISRRVNSAIDRGYLRNLEERNGKPSRLVEGDPMPGEIELLPTPEKLEELLQRCTVAEGDTTPPPPPVDEKERW